MENDETNDKKSSFLGKIKFWQISSIVLLILFVVSLIANFSGKGLSGAITKDDAQGKIQQYANIVTGGAIVDVGNIADDGENGLYKVPLTVKGQVMTGYITKDGKLFFPAAVNLDDFFKQVGTTGKTTEPVDNEQVQAPSEPIKVSVDDDPVLGDKDAPVTIIEFSDFQCPYCGKFESETFDQIKKDYIDTSKVKFVYRDFPLSFHQNAEKAAEASECADEQGKYWEYHDKLFENQQALTVEDLKEYAKELKLNTDKFNECLDSDAMKEEVQKDMEEGSSYGVSGVPAFFINGIELSGAQPYENFKKVIDEELNKAEE